MADATHMRDWPGRIMVLKLKPGRPLSDKVLISSSFSFRLAVSLELLRLLTQDLDGLLDRVQVGAQAQDGYT